MSEVPTEPAVSLEVPVDATTRLRAALDAATALDQRGPDAFKVGQDHLPPAFRAVDWRAAFNALAAVTNEITEAAEQVLADG